MRKVFVTLMGLCLLLSACHKEESSPPVTEWPSTWAGTQSYGWVKANRDGMNWEGSSTAGVVISNDNQFSLIFKTYDADTVLNEVMGFGFIPLKVGKYSLSTNATVNRNIYWVGYFDEIDALYKVARPAGDYLLDDKFPALNKPPEMNHRSFLWVDSYDPAAKLVTGRFQAFYVKSDNFRFNYPNFVAFTDGRFSVTLY